MHKRLRAAALLGALLWAGVALAQQGGAAGTLPLVIGSGAGGNSYSVPIQTLLFFTALVWNSVHRARHAGWVHWLGLITCVPYVGMIMTVILAFLPARKHTVWDLF